MQQLGVAAGFLAVPVQLVLTLLFLKLQAEAAAAVKLGVLKPAGMMPQIPVFRLVESGAQFLIQAALPAQLHWNYYVPASDILIK